jgi:hypothetical protein
VRHQQCGKARPLPQRNELALHGYAQLSTSRNRRPAFLRSTVAPDVGAFSLATERKSSRQGNIHETT